MILLLIFFSAAALFSIATFRERRKEEIKPSSIQMEDWRTLASKTTSEVTGSLATVTPGAAGLEQQQQQQHSPNLMMGEKINVQSLLTCTSSTSNFLLPPLPSAFILWLHGRVSNMAAAVARNQRTAPTSEQQHQ